MARKAVVSGGTRDEIIGVAKRLFFEKGFDGVTIRTIQREVGCEVGLFYYYFKSKDQVFDVVMEQLQVDWTAAMDEAVNSAEDDPREQLVAVIDCLYSNLKTFAGNDAVLHWSVRGALCDRMTTVASGYMKELLTKTGVSLRISEETLSVILAGGCGKILCGCSEWDYRKIRDEIKRLLDAVIPEYRGRSRELSVELL